MLSGKLKGKSSDLPTDLQMYSTVLYFSHKYGVVQGVCILSGQ